MPQPRNPARYQILDEHGRGGIGKVSRAHDLELGRDVAIKELLSRSAMHEVRFMREALITARLEHPGIVPVHEAGRWPDGTPFYAMKLVAGRPLRDLLAERGTVDERLALLHHVISVADAIAYAHQRNIIHRDLKPGNVIVGDFGETVVIDWGLAKDLSGSEESTTGGGPATNNRNDDLTSAGTILGTPAYMPPEQRRGDSVDQRADVYAIGVMLWELCSLERPPAMHSEHHHRSLRQAGIDPDLITIIEKALASDPDLRYADASALAIDLKAFKSGARIGARQYSASAMIAHWVRRHRVLTAGVAAAIVFTIIATIAYVRTVTTERDRTRAALRTADLQKRQAVIATATAILVRDPTQAWSTLAALGEDTQDTAVVEARIQAAGVAEVRIPLPGSIDRILPTPSRRQLIVSLREDRALYAIDLRTSKLRQLARHLTTPSVFTVTDTDVYVVRKLDHLAFTKIDIASSHSEDLTTLSQLPDDLMIGNSGLFWQTPDGLLSHLASSQHSETIASGVSQFAIAGHEAIICDKQHHLYVLNHQHSNHQAGIHRTLGNCKGSWLWAERNGNIAVPRDDQTILVYSTRAAGQPGSHRLVPLNNDNVHSFLALSTAGLLAAVDSQGNGAILRPQADSPELIRLQNQPTGTAAGKNRIAWTFQNGSVKVLDSTTRQEWSIKAHAAGSLCLFFISDERLLTCESKELRLWLLRADTPDTVAVLPSSAFHIVTNNAGERLLDAENGDVYFTPKEFEALTLLHKHSKLAFGVSWCDTRACSASWDGNITCRSPRALSSEIVASFGVPVRALLSDSGHCFAAVSNGGIYDVRAPSHALYQHGDEPNRLAMSKDGTRLASADWGGSIKTWSISGRKILGSIDQLHNARVTAITWTDDDKIVTAGLDGTINLLTNDLRVIQQWRFPTPVFQLALARDSLYAALADGTIRYLSLLGKSERTMALGVSISAFAASRSQKYIAVGSDEGELFIIDDKWRVAARRLDAGAVQCTVFDDVNSLLACTHDGHIFRINVTAQFFSGNIKK